MNAGQLFFKVKGGMPDPCGGFTENSKWGRFCLGLARDFFEIETERQFVIISLY
jgi:hypothetical protein